MLAGLWRLRPISGFRHQLLAFAQRRSSELSPCLRPALSAAAPRLGAHQRGLHIPAPAMGSDWSSLFSSNAAGPAGDDNKATAHAPAVSSAGATTTPSAAAAATTAASSAGAAQAAATPELSEADLVQKTQDKVLWDIPQWHVVATEAQVPPGATLAFIGDVHGCCDELAELLDKLPPEAIPIMVGDVVNKGPKSVECVQLLRKRGVLSVRGNHDCRAVTAYRIRKEHPELQGKWSWVDGLAPEDVKWLEQLPFTLRIRSHNVLVVHAGLVPGRPLIEQDPMDMYRMRNLQRTADGSWEAVSSGDGDGSVPWAPEWRGPEFVFFGHDAKRKLQVCDHARGLDTGCVYGRELTACLYPSLDLLTVPAKRVYEEPKGKP